MAAVPVPSTKRIGIVVGLGWSRRNRQHTADSILLPDDGTSGGGGRRAARWADPSRWDEGRGGGGGGISTPIPFRVRSAGGCDGPLSGLDPARPHSRRHRRGVPPDESSNCSTDTGHGGPRHCLGARMDGQCARAERFARLAAASRRQLHHHIRHRQRDCCGLCRTQCHLQRRKDL